MTSLPLLSHHPIQPDEQPWTSASNYNMADDLLSIERFNGQDDPLNPFAPWRFEKELPADRTKLAKAWKLLESYSGIPPDEIEDHLVAIVCFKLFVTLHPAR